MQVSALKTEGLVHQYEVKVPAADIQRQVDNKLKHLGATAKMDGFRPGKAPLAIIQKRYGQSVLGEVVENTVNTATLKAVNEKSLRPAVEPRIEFSNVPEELPASKDLIFKMEVELIPEIEAADFSTVALEKPMVEVSDADLTEAMDRIAKGNRVPEKMPADFAAKKGDVATIDFDGSIDGERRDGMKGEDFALELGSGRFIPGFEDQLIGVKTGDARDVKVPFPKDYYVAELAGKDAVFKVTVKSISQLKSPDVNDDLAKAVGFDTLEALQKDVKEQISQNYNEVTRAIMKRRLMDALADAHTFAVPPTLKAREFETLWQQISQAKASGQLDEDDKKKTDEQLKADYEGIAERRVRLGLLLSDVASKNKIELSREDVRQAIFREAMRYKGQEKQVIEYLTKNANAREQLVAPLLEEKVVDFIFGKAKVTEKKITRDELTKLAEG
jgi:trigger factor